MRTTVTFEQDVAEQIKQYMRQTGKSFKETVNAIMRRGLRVETEPMRPFKVQPIAGGERSGLNYDNIGELLEQVEGPDYK